ncbi:MAG TPA: TIGR01777 family oxidoreductase [Blastocatellia bacterium]|nr:TIGR01777 family oxidoreductase [Blastocatellia bacterium]
MKILITGATGLIGRAICQLLANEDSQIVVLSRRQPATIGLTGASSFRWEPEAESPPAQAWDGVDAVIHLAGEPVATARWTEEQKRRIRDSRVKGTRNLVAGMRVTPNPPKILISASAVGFYGDRGDEILNESSNPGADFLSDVCLNWEAEAARARDLGVRVALVRIGVALSSSGGVLEKMLTPFKLGLGGRLGGGRQWFPWIHIDDIVGIFHHALMTSSIDGPINGVAPGVVTNDEFTRELAAALNRPVFFPIPEFALRLLMGEIAEAIMSSQRVVPQVAPDTGYRFKYPNLRPALESLLRK